MSIEREKNEIVETADNAEFIEKLESTVNLFSELNAVEGIYPETMTVCYQGDDGSMSLYLPAEPAMLWFRAKHPNGRLEQIITKLNDSYAIVEGRVFDGNGAMLANAFVMRYRGDDEYGKNYIQNAGTSAIRKALGNCGFGTPMNSRYVEGVTKIQQCSSAPVDAGVVIKPPVPPIPQSVPNSSQRTQPPVDNIMVEDDTSSEEKKHNESANEKDGKEVKRQNPNMPTPPAPVVQAAQSQSAVETLKDALAFTITVGRCKGKTFQDLIDEKQYQAIRFFLRENYQGTDIQKAAQMVAGQYAL